MSTYEPRCKVCTSSNKKEYEAFFLANTEIPLTKLSPELEEKAKVFGEEISYKAFERHFTRHFSATITELASREEEVTEVVKTAKKEVIDIVAEIKNNLNGLKTLLNKSLEAYKDKTITPGMLRGLTDLYREHRQSIEACDRLTNKLTEGTQMSEAEMLKFLYLFAKNLCPACAQRFKANLDDYLERKR